MGVGYAHRGNSVRSPNRKVQAQQKEYDSVDTPGVNIEFFSTSIPSIFQSTQSLNCSLCSIYSICSIIQSCFRVSSPTHDAHNALGNNYSEPGTGTGFRPGLNARVAPPSTVSPARSMSGREADRAQFPDPTIRIRNPPTFRALCAFPTTPPPHYLKPG